MKKIIPIKDLKNTSDISGMCYCTDESVYITENGYGCLQSRYGSGKDRPRNCQTG